MTYQCVRVGNILIRQAHIVMDYVGRFNHHQCVMKPFQYRVDVSVRPAQTRTAKVQHVQESLYKNGNQTDNRNRY